MAPVPEIVEGIAAYSAATGVAVAPALKALVERFWANDKKRTALRAVRARLLADRPEPGDEAALIGIYNQVVGQLVDPDFLRWVDSLLERGDNASIDHIRSHLLQRLHVPDGADRKTLVELIVNELRTNVGRAQRDALAAADVVGALQAARTIEAVEQSSMAVQGTVEENARCMSGWAERLSSQLEDLRLITSTGVVSGPREVGFAAAKFLLALDDACWRLNEPASHGTLVDMVNQAVEFGGSANPLSQTATRSLRAVLVSRGMDPRVAVVQLPGHEEALRKWRMNVPGPGDRLAGLDPVGLLPRLRLALVGGIASLPEDIAPPAVCNYLSRLFASGDEAPPDPHLLTVLSAIDDALPPPRATSREAVRVTDRGSPQLTSVDGRQRHPTLGHVARQMCQLPRHDPFIVGLNSFVEEKAARLLAEIAQQGSSTAWCYGLPGVGGSTFAIEMARVTGDKFDNVRYVDLRGLDPKTRRTPADALSLLAHAQDIDLGTTTSDDERFATFNSELDGSSTLIVLDHAIDADHVSPFVPPPSSCGLIVASRQRLQDHAPPKLVSQIQRLNPADSARLLKTSTSTESDSQYLSDIAALCDRLPLALRLARARIASSTDMSAADIATLLRSSSTRLDYLAVGERAIRASIGLSYHHLDDETRSILLYLAAAPMRAVTATILAGALGKPLARTQLLLYRLVDHSLATQQTVRTGTGRPTPRFQLPELIFLFAYEQVESELPVESVERFRRRCIAQLSEELDELVPTEPDADLTLELDTSGLRAALTMAVDCEWHEEGLKLAHAVEDLAVSLYDPEFMEEAYARQAILHQQAGTIEPAIRTMLRGAERLVSRNRPTRAKAMITEAVDLAAKHRFSELMADAAFRLSVLAADEEDWDAALRSGELSATTFERLGRGATAVPVAINNSRIAERAGKKPTALHWGSEGWRLAQMSREDEHRASAAAQYALASQQSDDHTMAVKLYERAEHQYVEDASELNASIAAHNGAVSARVIGDADKELELLLNEVALLEACAEPVHLVMALIDASAAQFRSGAYPDAQSSLGRAVAILESPDGARLPAHLRYEVFVRALAIRGFTDDQPVLGPDAVVGIARKRLPVPKDQSRVDPAIEPVLEIIGLADEGALTRRQMHRMVSPLLASGTINPGISNEFWLHKELGSEPAVQQTLEQGDQQTGEIAT